MKKIININLSGRVIPIEDSAYEKLQAYIESLRRYFAKEEDRDEIINDIESRIAELMNEKIRKGAACITDADIDEIASSMGRPEDLDADMADEKTTYSGKSSQQQSSFTETKRKSRLYRDVNDKFIGGVCSGIAAYLNIDTAIVRILFAIITFGGFGLGFLIYILLWIILPAKDVEHSFGKRLYRNPDDRVIGGVAGGLASYFNRETWIIRLIFAAPFVLSILIGIIRAMTWNFGFNFYPNIVFGSLGSTLVLAYIILWIVLPEARSTYEKMEMRGEKVDVNAIRQNMRDRLKEWGEEVKESAINLSNKAKEYSTTAGKKVATEVGQASRRGGYGFGHAIGVLFKIFFIFIAGSIAFGLFVGLMALLFGGIAWWPINNFLWTSKWQQVYAWGTIIFFLVVPLIGFITWLVRRIIGVRSRSSYLGWTFACLWTIGWVAAILLTTSMFNDFAEYEHAPERVIPVSQPANGRMVLTVSQPELEYTGRFGWVNDGGDGWDLSSDTLRLSWVNFEIDKSRDSLYHVSILNYSAGRTRYEAVNRAENFDYTVNSSDSILDLASGFAIASSDKFRGQRVIVSIQVPVGKKIRFEESVKRKLNPTNVRYRNYRNRWHGIDVVFNDRVSFWWRSGVDYVMQEDGKLLDSRNKRFVDDPSNEYRYEDDGPKRDTLEMQRQLEEEKRKQREKKVEAPAGAQESMGDDDDEEVASSAFPTFSLIKAFY